MKKRYWILIIIIILLILFWIIITYIRKKYGCYNCGGQGLDDAVYKKIQQLFSNASINKTDINR